MKSRFFLSPVAKPALFVLALLPFFWLLFAAVTNQLGANPAEALSRATGDWSLRLLCIVLAVTPLRVLTRMHASLQRLAPRPTTDRGSARRARFC